MINIKPHIVTALKNTGVNVEYYYPEHFNSLPIISYYIPIDKTAVKTDVERLEEFVVVVDVWSENSTSDLAIKVNDEMNKIGFTRVGGGDVDEKEIHHKNMRFRGIVDTRTLNVYK